MSGYAKKYGLDDAGRQTSLTAAIRRNLLARRDEIIQEVAYAAIQASPVDTGAYVKSFSVTTQSGGGRGYSSHGKPRKQSEEAKKAEARAQIDSDIAALPDNATKVYITNRAPHAPFVEARGSAPMATARRRASNF